MCVCCKRQATNVLAQHCTCLPSLPSSRSHWLRDRARPHIEAALRRGAAAAGGATTAADATAVQLLALLSGHQLAAAAALAAATGNPRLASLLAQAGTKGLGAAELGEQLRVWEESGCERHIAAGLRRVYQLLAGQVDDVVPAMQASSWVGRTAAAAGMPLVWDQGCLKSGPQHGVAYRRPPWRSPRFHEHPSTHRAPPPHPPAAGLAACAGRAPLVRLPAHSHCGGGSGLIHRSSGVGRSAAAAAALC